MEGAGVFFFISFMVDKLLGSLICQIWITRLISLLEGPLDCLVSKMTVVLNYVSSFISELNISLYYFLLVGTEQNLVSSGVFTVAELYTYARSECSDMSYSVTLCMQYVQNITETTFSVIFFLFNHSLYRTNFKAVN